jgi:2-oxoglutarate dehydrogenase E1 component
MPFKFNLQRYTVELDPALYGFTEADLDREFFLGTWRMKGFLSEVGQRTFANPVDP